MAEPNNTPIPGSTPRSMSPAPQASSLVSPTKALLISTPPANLPPAPTSAAPRTEPQPSSPPVRILLVGGTSQVVKSVEPIIRHSGTVIQLPPTAQSRAGLVQTLKDEALLGELDAVMWLREGEPGHQLIDKWDEELLSLLPPSVMEFWTELGAEEAVDAAYLRSRGVKLCASLHRQEASASEEKKRRAKIDLIMLLTVWLPHLSRKKSPQPQ